MILHHMYTYIFCDRPNGGKRYVLHSSSSFAVGRVATKTVFMKLIYFTAALHAILCWVNSASWLMLISLFFKFLFMVSLYRRRGRPRFLTPSESCEYMTFFGSRSDSIRSIWPVHRKFFLMSRSSKEEDCHEITWYISHIILPHQQSRLMFSHLRLFHQQLFHYLTSWPVKFNFMTIKNSHKSYFSHTRLI